MVGGMSPSLFSYGGGTQSTACLVLAARGDIHFDHWVMADVGADSENPETLEYYEKHALPFAEAHGINLVTTRWDRRTGVITLREYLDEIKTSIPIPVNFGQGPASRLCTLRWKIEPVARYHKRVGATTDTPGAVGLGFSTDEVHRCRDTSKHAWQTPVYPLIDLGLSRQDCIALVMDAGLPEPPNSCCWFCPFQRPSQWEERRRTHPELIDEAIELETMLSERTEAMGKGPCWIGGKAPLTAVLAQGNLFDSVEGDDQCTGASCFT